MYHLTSGALPHKSGVHYLQIVVAVLSSLSFPLTFLICLKHVSDAYEAAPELPQIAAWGFMENPTSYFSLNTPGHELPLHSLCFMKSSPKSSCPVDDHRGLRWSRTGIWQEVCTHTGTCSIAFCIFCHPGYRKTFSSLFEWIHERIFHLYANRAFAQGCFAASHCDGVNHVLTTQPVPQFQVSSAPVTLETSD